MQVFTNNSFKAARPPQPLPPVTLHAAKRPSFRPEPEGLSREELRKIVAEMIG